MDNKVVVVTGGLGGIGLHITKTLAANGYKVYATYKNKSEEDAIFFKNRIEHSENIECVYLDITDTNSCVELYTKIINSGESIFGLVNNAGVTADSSFKKMRLEQWKKVLDTNLYSLFNTTQPVFIHMLERGIGCIINISSVNALKGQFGQANYCSAKAGIIGFSKALAHEGAASGVRVNVIAPGYTDTEMVRAIPKTILENIVKTIPTGKLVKPEHVAAAVSFLLSDAGQSITGETISVNCGLVMN